MSFVTNVRRSYIISDFDFNNRYGTENLVSNMVRTVKINGMPVVMLLRDLLTWTMQFNDVSNAVVACRYA